MRWHHLAFGPHHSLEHMYSDTAAGGVARGQDPGVCRRQWQQRSSAHHWQLWQSGQGCFFSAAGCGSGT
jgi:hypothetical protein